LVKKLSQLYLDARNALMTQEDPQYAGMVARNLVCFVTGKTPEQVLADREQYVSDPECIAMDELVQRVLNGEPLAYILGEWEFYGLKLKVTPDVLIPRDDTCAVTALAIKKALFLKENPRVLDLCTGSGCIGLAIANRVKDARVTLADISKDALAVARTNAMANGLGRRATCMQADALGEPASFLGMFDMIVSNPPYITTEEMQTLPVSVKDYEPHLALHGGADGLDFYRGIIKNYTKCLKDGGFLCFEYGEGQGDAICALLEANSYTILERSRDFNDTERACVAQLRKKED